MGSEWQQTLAYLLRSCDGRPLPPNNTVATCAVTVIASAPGATNVHLRKPSHKGLTILKHSFAGVQNDFILSASLDFRNCVPKDALRQGLRDWTRCSYPDVWPLRTTAAAQTRPYAACTIELGGPYPPEDGVVLSILRILSRMCKNLP
jgi:hypothetical protein